MKENTMWEQLNDKLEASGLIREQVPDILKFMAIIAGIYFISLLIPLVVFIVKILGGKLLSKIRAR